MNNNFSKMNNSLYRALERLNDENLTNNLDLANTEIARSNAIASICKTLVATTKTRMDILKLEKSEKININEINLLKNEAGLTNEKNN